MAYETIQLELGATSILTIDRPDKLNALNAQVLTELEHALGELEARDDVRALILTGSGPKSFVAGADIQELARVAGTDGEAMARRGQRLLARLEAAPFVTVAAINGFALGGGLELAMACDVRLASEKAKLGLPEVTLGIIPGYAGTQRLPRIVGQGRALELIVSGQMIDAARAEAIGLVNRVVPPEALMEAAQDFAAAVAKVGPMAVRKAKWLVYYGQDVPFERACEAEAAAFGILCTTGDKAEGTAAFLEKRAAEFLGN